MEQIKGQTSIDDFLGNLLKQPMKKKEAKPATSAITKATRKDSHEKTNKQKMTEKVVGALKMAGKPLSAREIAQEMYKAGWIPYPARAVVQPRITELVQVGVIEVYGVKMDEETERKVAVYKVV